MVTPDIKIKHKPFVYVVFVRTNVQEKLEDAKRDNQTINGRRYKTKATYIRIKG
jgi:hypothetical protein